MGEGGRTGDEEDDEGCEEGVEEEEDGAEGWGGGEVVGWAGEAAGGG